MVGERLDAPQEDEEVEEEQLLEARPTKEGNGGNLDSLYAAGARGTRLKKQYVKSKLHTVGVRSVKRSVRFLFHSLTKCTHDCGYIRCRLLVPRVSEYRLTSSSSNTTRSLRVNDTTLTDEPTSDWLAMQSITEYSDNSTRRVPPLGFPPSVRSAVSVGPRPTCTLARRHGTQCRSYATDCKKENSGTSHFDWIGSSSVKEEGRWFPLLVNLTGVLRNRHTELTYNELEAPLRQAINETTPYDWKGFRKHVETLEHKYWTKDGIIEDATEDLELEIQSSESDKKSDDNS
ncbi:hypothetical protein WN48_08609 [Eufriesea mexicana]|uniref:Uncharacterized protein n=1 Tax=Eufriesea mexicana TaxID=516756 RepID=A0A310SAD9_9HYME|nr:hypothetical protein WN48_08609 [Eufriesea mexicana]